MALEATGGASLIGRGEDRAALGAALSEARGGEPVTVIVGGDAGIGKTRLVQEFAQRAFAEGARVLVGTCVELADASLPYVALADALRTLPPDAYDELAPPLRRELGVLVPETAPDGDAAGGSQSALFGAVLRLLEQPAGASRWCSSWRTCTGWTARPRTCSGSSCARCATARWSSCSPTGRTSWGATIPCCASSPSSGARRA